MVAQVVVVNDDAAAGRDSNESDKMLDLLLDALPCRLAGGFMTNERVYDWLDKAPGQIAMVGVAMMSTPFLLLSAILRTHAKAAADEADARKRKMIAEAEEAEGRLVESKIRRAVATGSFATLSLHSVEDKR